MTYKLIPEEIGSIARVAVIASPVRRDLEVLESFLDSVPDAKITMLVYEDEFNTLPEIYTTLRGIADFQIKHSSRVDVSRVPSSVFQGVRTIKNWARNALWGLQNNQTYTIIPTCCFFREATTHSLQYMDVGAFNTILFSSDFSPTYFEQQNILRWFNNADVIVTTDVVVVGYDALELLISGDRRMRTICFEKLSSEKTDLLEERLDELTPQITELLSPYINGQQVVLLPKLPPEFYDLDTAMTAYDTRGFFVADTVIDTVVSRLRKYDIDVTPYPVPTWSVIPDTTTGMQYQGIHAADINVLTEIRAGKKIVYLPNRPDITRFGVMIKHEPDYDPQMYLEYQEQCRGLWQDKGFQVRYITYPLANNTGLRCFFQVVKRGIN